MNGEEFVARLEGVRSRGRGRWTSKCPAHDDRSPSLSVREKDDGRILIQCFAGCEAQAIVESLGLTFSDLYPDKPISHHVRGVRHNSRDLLHLVRREAMVVVLAAEDLKNGKPLSEGDHSRLLAAVGRIAVVVNES